MPVKHISQWTINDLHELIESNQPENLTLEYKRSLVLDNWKEEGCRDLARHVSAFANATGGVIVIGIIEKKPHPLQLDDGTDISRISPEALESVLNYRISPKVDNLNISYIFNPQREGFVYYLIEVPASTHAPHMNNYDNKYYKRHNFNSEPMEHYEIEDIRGRKQGPLLVTEVNMYLVPITTLSRQVTSYLSIHVTNVGSEIAREVLIRLYIPFELLVINGGWLTNKVSYGDEDATIYQLFEIYPDIGNKPLVLYPSDSRGLQIISKNLPERLYIGFPDPHAQARKNWNAQFGDATYNIEPEIDYSHPAIHKNIIIELFADRMVMQRNIISISHLIKTAAFD